MLGRCVGESVSQLSAARLVSATAGDLLLHLLLTQCYSESLQTLLKLVHASDNPMANCKTLLQNAPAQGTSPKTLFQNALEMPYKYFDTFQSKASAEPHKLSAFW